MSRPGTVSRGRPSRGATDAAPLRVVAERLPLADVAGSVSGPAPAVTAPPVEPVEPLPDSASVPTPAVGLPLPSAPEAALVLDPRGGTARAGVMSRLVALVIGRRAGGRHRPDTVRAWSMFAPPSGARRRTLRAR